MKKKDIRSEDQVTQSKKRTAMKTLVVGIGGVGLAAPQKWSKPIVNSVSLPAHAATTDAGGDGGSGTTTEAPFNGTFSGDVDEIFASNFDGIDAEQRKSPLDMIVGQAHAGISDTFICVTVANGQFDADLQEFGNYFSLSGSVGDSPVDMIDECELKTFIGFKMAVNSAGPGGINITVDPGRGGAVTKTITNPGCLIKFGCDE